MSTAIYSYVHDTSNPITTSGSYQLFPTVYVLGIASSGGGEAVFSGSDVTASISFAPALINAINPYIVESENGAKSKGCRDEVSPCILSTRTWHGMVRLTSARHRPRKPGRPCN